MNLFTSKSNRLLSLHIGVLEKERDAAEKSLADALQTISEQKMAIEIQLREHGRMIELHSNAAKERDLLHDYALEMDDLCADAQEFVEGVMQENDALNARQHKLVADLHVMTMNRDNEESENRALKIQMAEALKSRKPRSRRQEVAPVAESEAQI